jgi:hypothetical protein
MYKVGMIVTHPNKPEWGPGKIQALNGNSLIVYFRDFLEKKPGDAQKTLSTDYVKLNIASVQNDPWLDNLPPYKQGQTQPPKIRLTMKQGIEAFLAKFPAGFSDQGYFKEERQYKWDAHQHYVELLGDGQYEKLLSSDTLNELVKRILSVESKVNLLNKYEKVAFRDALKDKNASGTYLGALQNVLLEGPKEDVFTPYFESVNDLPAEVGKSRVATWPVATVLPYLARPDVFMFLKPEVTKDCAERLKFNLNYDSKPNWLTYSKLMIMCDLLMQHLKPLGARDMIDLQSFIWCIGRQ